MRLLSSDPADLARRAEHVFSLFRWEQILYHRANQARSFGVEETALHPSATVEAVDQGWGRAAVERGDTCHACTPSGALMTRIPCDPWRPPAMPVRAVPVRK